MLIDPPQNRQKYESLHISAMSQSEAYVRVNESSFIGQLSPPSRNSSTIGTGLSGTMDCPVPVLKRPSTLLRPTLSQQTFLPLTTPAAHPTLPDPPISPVGEDNEGTLPPQPRPTLMMIKRRARSGGSTAFSDFPRHKFPTAGTTPASIAVARFSDASQISVDDEIFTNRVQRVLEQ
ncbi:hypothetical protein BLNAU_17898 [Blattamonas nauphoetae]|uniref:Uncharacterized protein n=1 Tax=Blattamonas nauphoetae TaxID=2049346 RepID=A0ABQ9X6I7_9EUKA|nr:hypothetical protein BLNAU_17898 [Blattamonas nauphoetae]